MIVIKAGSDKLSTQIDHRRLRATQLERDLVRSDGDELPVFDRDGLRS